MTWAFFCRHAVVPRFLLLFRLAALGAMLALRPTTFAQQVSDAQYQPPVPRPAYVTGAGPRVGIDEAHHNYHTAAGRYRTFAELLRRDGYRVRGFAETLTSRSLAEIDILVIVNPLNARNVSDWSLPTPSAYTETEISAVCAWVEQGGSLFLVADHMPFPGAAGELAKVFGFEFSNGYARDGRWKGGQPNTFDPGAGLGDSLITRGRFPEEKVTRVTTFGGSAFKMPAGATAILTFGPNSFSHETAKAGVIVGAPQVKVDGWSQGAVLSLGTGRIAVFGEAAMFTAQHAGPDKRPMGMNAPEAGQNHQLLLNLMHWLSRAENTSP